MRHASLSCSLAFLAAFALSCSPLVAQGATSAPPPVADPRLARALAAADAAGLPTALRAAIASKSARFFEVLEPVLAVDALDPALLLRVDKLCPLDPDFAPSDLALLSEYGIPLTRADHKLRAVAASALAELAKAARADGVSLSVASAYRSYAYQKSVYARWVSELGKAQADRVSAEPGKSQHQLGSALDFAPIDNAFALSPQGRWVKANAARFGFSLSYPEGKEALTGYDWESWHWRYIGKPAVRLQAEFFGDTQHWMLLFLDAWRKARP